MENEKTRIQNKQEGLTMKNMSGLIIGIVCALVSIQPVCAQEGYTLGVLAPKGAEVAKTEWQPTAEYLSAHTGKAFTLVPLRFRSFEPAVKRGKMDFILCNPVVFSQMMDRYEARPLVSLIEAHQGEPLQGFGAVIFTLADSDIQTLTDMKGKNVAATQRNALMGYQLQMYVFQQHGVDLHKDTEVTFAGKLPLVVNAVKSGAADVGFVRTGFLEWLEEQGQAKASDFKVIEPETDDYPYPHNGPILPYWMFGAAKDTDAALADDVATALKAMPHDSPAAKAANIYGYEDPADLAPVRDMLQSIQ
jgi:ABC-type phosphate/phosphonate transport system substrate-binding protein